NRYIVAPALGTAATQGAEGQPAALRGIGVELGRLVPHLSLLQAVGYRLRRNYGYVFSLVIVAWLLKLEVHPTGATSMAVVVDRAAIGVLMPGPVVMIVVLTAAAIATALALAAPTERMVDWADLPS